MTHSELYNRFQSIQTTKDTLREEMFNYILCTLRSNENHIDSSMTMVRFDHVEEDFPFVLTLADKKMHLMGMMLTEDKNMQVKVVDAEDKKFHQLVFEMDNMENLETAAAFINHTLVEIGEKNLYTFLVVYNNNNSRNLTPGNLKGLDDNEIWMKLTGLKSHEVKIYQMKGPKQKYQPFEEFITQMNEDGVGGCYAIQLHLKEKFL